MMRVEGWRAPRLVSGLVRLSLVIGPLALCIGSPEKVRVNVDHLVPTGEIVDPAYQKLLAQKLYATDANYVRIVVLPSTASVGELALSIHSKDPASPGAAVLTCTRAERNLWYAASELSLERAVQPSVVVERSDADFPADLAASLASAIAEMVRRSRQPHSSDRISVHGTDLLFSVGEAADSIQARLAPESAGPNSAALRRIADLLEKYCTGGVAKRRLIMRRLMDETKKLQRLAAKGKQRVRVGVP